MNNYKARLDRIEQQLEKRMKFSWHTVSKSRQCLVGDDGRILAEIGLVSPQSKMWKFREQRYIDIESCQKAAEKSVQHTDELRIAVQAYPLDSPLRP